MTNKYLPVSIGLFLQIQKLMVKFQRVHLGNDVSLKIFTTFNPFPPPVFVCLLHYSYQLYWNLPTLLICLLILIPLTPAKSNS